MIVIQLRLEFDAEDLLENRQKVLLQPDQQIDRPTFVKERIMTSESFAQHERAYLHYCLGSSGYLSFVTI
jgi:hypothetical protein